VLELFDYNNGPNLAQRAAIKIQYEAVSLFDLTLIRTPYVFGHR
jgi:hypothetical protein